jgi:hypothetical protein
MKRESRRFSGWECQEMFLCNSVEDPGREENVLESALGIGSSMSAERG